MTERDKKILTIEKEVDTRLSCSLELYGLDDQLVKLKKQEQQKKNKLLVSNK